MRFVDLPTGTIKVDTTSAGFVVAKVPLASKVTVAGKVIADGDEIEIEAGGIDPSQLRHQPPGKEVAVRQGKL